MKSSGMEIAKRWVRSSDEETKARIQGSRGNEPAESSSYPHRNKLEK